MSKRTDKDLDATAAHVKALSKILDAHTAEYIVRVVKSHKDLLEACKAMVTDFDLGEHSIKHSLKLMEAAIANAGG